MHNMINQYYQLYHKKGDFNGLLNSILTVDILNMHSSNTQAW